MNKTGWKYTIRKLGFIVVLAALVASPFLVQAYESATTTDPFILMAREIEGFETGGVDVINLKDDPNVPNAITMLVNIEDFPNWSVRKDQHNFKNHVIRTIDRYDYEAVSIFLGWDWPAEDFHIQAVIVCPELRVSSCEWTYVPSTKVEPRYIEWPGIGNP